MAEPWITGSFFDLAHVNLWDAAYWVDTCRFWRAENWRALIADMHGVGIDTAILTTTALWGRPLFGGYEKTVGRQLKMGCDDPLGACVAEADRLGMKMFIGFGLRGRCSQVRDYSNMQPPWCEAWFTFNRALAVAIMELYSHRPCFAGLYIPYEIDFIDYQVDLYEKLMREYIRPACGDVPVLASPGSLGDVADLESLPRQIERTTVNILAPQDYGGRRSDVGQAMELVRGNARGLERVRKSLAGAGITLWCNCEVFDFEPSPDGRAMCIPGPIERIEQQIQLQAPLAEKLICYQYQGIMNRRTDLVNIGRADTQKLYDAYAAYRRRAMGRS